MNYYLFLSNHYKYNSYDTSYNDVYGNGNGYGDSHHNSGSSPRFWNNFVAHLMVDHIKEKQKMSNRELSSREGLFPTDDMSPDIVSNGVINELQ